MPAMLREAGIVLGGVRVSVDVSLSLWAEAQNH